MEQRQRPLLGVVTTTVPGRAHPSEHQADCQPSPIWCVLEQRAHELGLTACLIRPEDVDFERGQVSAWVCARSETDSDVTEQWQFKRCPLPDVVYENVYVHLSGSREIRRLRRRFQERGIPLFNPSLGDKSELANWLRHYPDLWQHHPPTDLCRRSQQVFAWLHRDPSVYLKPVFGSAGQGIFEVRAQADGRYWVRAAKHGPHKQPFDRMMSRAALTRLLRRELQQTDFILQAGCELLHVEGCKIDLRTHLQRNRSGEWECVALIVKQGRPHSIVSNYHAGGAVHEWEWLEEQAERLQVPDFPDEESVISLSERIAAAYADKAPHLASIGLDLGIDTNGSIWLLDVNSRPGRNILNAEQKERCQRLNAEFAAFLLESLD